jgi:hypothetical protein
MDATRTRRTRDRARQGWYACYRQLRFARYLGFADGLDTPVSAATVVQLSFRARATIGLRLDPTPTASSAPLSARYPHSVAVAAQ